ncbi:MAG: hypothetical protein DRO07_03230 [Candidatus Iainarchaeum archaeon]|uniref:Uncharacterized protein n=1 Tax=Candidatus Iainarchaeum sp. TaxID=3101447 RepID=A0A497JFF9_9ARCH|nr:MAG: hypothetical protein DRO07_03230 [Candidatus Diapherotrites archaeon]
MGHENLKEKLINRFKQFLKGAKENTLLFYHSDADGLTASVIMAKTFEKLGNEAPLALPAEYFETEKMLSAFEKHKPANVIFLDIAIDSKPKVVQKIEKHAKLLVIDHHKISNDISSEKTVFIKPQMLSAIEPSRYPASKLCFDLCSSLINLKKEAWIACVGIIGDKSAKQWREFLNKTSKENNVSIEELKCIAELVEAVKVVAPESFAELFELFYFLSPKQILKHPLNEMREKLNEALKEWQERFEKEAEYYSKLELYFFVMKPEFPIKSALIDRLTEKYPDKTIIIVEDLEEQKLRFSARRQDFKVKMNELLEKAAQGIPKSDAGGHIPAAAGSIPRGYLKEFKENLLNILKEVYRKEK